MNILKPSINWMFIFIPITLVLDNAGGIPAPYIFFSADLSIIPIARLIVAATEQLATRTGDAIGGLLNATFGNAPELIIAVVALKAGLFDMVRASLIGAILANLLVALGLRLFGSWEMNWLAYNAAPDLLLPGASRGKVPFFMYPQAETAEGRLDCLDPENFRYQIAARELAA